MGKKIKTQDYCCDCEVFKNYEEKEFMLGFFCPIQNTYVTRNEISCENILSDGLTF